MEFVKSKIARLEPFKRKVNETLASNP